MANLKSTPSEMLSRAQTLNHLKSAHFLRAHALMQSNLSIRELRSGFSALIKEANRAYTYEVVDILRNGSSQVFLQATISEHAKSILYLRGCRAASLYVPCGDMEHKPQKQKPFKNSIFHYGLMHALYQLGNFTKFIKSKVVPPVIMIGMYKS